MIKIDWLSFVYLPDEDEKATYNDIFSAFKARFPKIESILDETIVIRKGYGYYTTGVCWNDGICIHWDDIPSDQDFYLTNGKILEPWTHGVYVSFPAHGLHYLPELLGLDCKFDGDYSDIKPIFQYLKENNCRLSRLDICYDDLSKKYTPSDFLHFWDNNQIQSPCSKFRYAGNSGKGNTIYFGARSNKLLRIYDKELESKGEIKSIRYEIESHNRFANDLMDMILSDNFNFFDVLQKWFIRIKVKSDAETFNKGKRYLSMLPDLPEWEEFIRDSSQKLNLGTTVFPVHSYDVTMNKKDHWLYNGVAPSLLMFTHFHGVDQLFDLLGSTTINQRNKKLLDDSCRIYGITEDQIKKNVHKSDIIKMICFEIEKAFKGLPPCGV